MYSQFMMHGQKNIKLTFNKLAIVHNLRNTLRTFFHFTHFRQMASRTGTVRWAYIKFKVMNHSGLRETGFPSIRPLGVTDNRMYTRLLSHRLFIPHQTSPYPSHPLAMTQIWSSCHVKCEDSSFLGCYTMSNGKCF